MTLPHFYYDFYILDILLQQTYNISKDKEEIICL